MRALLVRFHTLICHTNFRPGLAWQMPYRFTPWDLRTAVTLLSTVVSERPGSSRAHAETLQLLCPFVLSEATYGSHVVDPSDAFRVRLLFRNALQRSTKSARATRKGSIRRPSLNQSASARRGSARGSISGKGGRGGGLSSPGSTVRKLRVSTGVLLPVSAAEHSISSEVDDFVTEVFGQQDIYGHGRLSGSSRATDGVSGDDILLRAEETFMKERTIESLRQCTRDLCHVFGREVLDKETKKQQRQQWQEQQQQASSYEDKVEDSCSEILTALPARIVLSAAHGGNAVGSQIAVSLVDSKVREEALLFNKTLGDIRTDIELLRSAMRGDCKPGPHVISLCDALSQHFVPAKWDIYAPMDGSLAMSLGIWCRLTVHHRSSMQNFLAREHRIVMIGLFSWPRSLVASMYQEFARKRKVSAHIVRGEGRGGGGSASFLSSVLLSPVLLCSAMPTSSCAPHRTAPHRTASHRMDSSLFSPSTQPTGGNERHRAPLCLHEYCSRRRQRGPCAKFRLDNQGLFSPAKGGGRGPWRSGRVEQGKGGRV